MQLKPLGPPRLALYMNTLMSMVSFQDQWNFFFFDMGFLCVALAVLELDL